MQVRVRKHSRAWIIPSNPSGGRGTERKFARYIKQCADLAARRISQREATRDDLLKELGAQTIPVGKQLLASMQIPPKRVDNSQAITYYFCVNAIGPEFTVMLLSTGNPPIAGVISIPPAGRHAATLLRKLQGY